MELTGTVLTKYTHATVVFTKGERSLVVDPGSYTPNSAELVASAEAALVTHDHADHFDAEVLAAALVARPELTVYAPASVTSALSEALSSAGDTAAAESVGTIVTVSAGDTFTAAGFDIAVFGDDHAVIHRDIPLVQNVGYLIDGAVFHPGDAYLEPGVPVETLLMPVSGPWINTEQAVDYVRAVAPTWTIQIHDLMLSDAGKGSTAQFLGADGLTGVPMTLLAVGESTTL
ncbi:MBL fold metallo-hydrolase [Frondihabitans sp. VKM Ac-2883]|uniref:MBL fold metallo-hydrolase n=1 Tax=Frondihabitans sp. VKM Ac-2883 TaxID=2783823 RepID=UPI00188BAF60|nr:MBL fold metallo-hydrolase [Frondihabitans sp. VKM Ac-2883]MBF4577298.1 MBL fold metallo-hydrolase [Frondihabitans sp. VKM Ac-2883]